MDTASRVLNELWAARKAEMEVLSGQMAAELRRVLEIASSGGMQSLLEAADEADSDTDSNE